MKKSHINRFASLMLSSGRMKDVQNRAMLCLKTFAVLMLFLSAAFLIPSISAASVGFCTYTLDPTSASVSAAGVTGSTFAVSGIQQTSGDVEPMTPLLCPWTATSNNVWITITGVTAGTVTYDVAENTTCSARSGAITITEIVGGNTNNADQYGVIPIPGATFTINQAAGTCTYTINPTSASVGAAGAIGSTVDVDPSLDCCNWTAASNDLWIIINSGDSGTGDGVVNYTVEANNTGAARTGTMTIAGETFTVDQPESNLPACVVLYIKSNTENGSKEFVDGSASDHTIIAKGDIHHGDSDKFGGSTAICLDGKGDYLRVDKSQDWSFGEDDFTIDLWVNFSKITNLNQEIFSTTFSPINTKGFYMRADNGKFVWYHRATGALKIPAKPVKSQWYHLAVVRDGNTLSIYVNGSKEITSDCTGATFGASNLGLVFGKTEIGPVCYFNGYMDEITVCKGCARWTDDFTPPNPPGDSYPPKK